MKSFAKVLVHSNEKTVKDKRDPDDTKGIETISIHLTNHKTNAISCEFIWIMECMQHK